MNRKLTFFFLILFAIPTLADEKADKLKYPWLDEFHSGFSESVEETALWFDDFFAEGELRNSKSATGEARVSMGWEPRSTHLNEFDLRFKVRVKLPNLKHMSDIVFSDYDEEEQNAPIRAVTNEAVTEQNRFNLALRWVYKKGKKSAWTHRLGIGRKVQPFVKSRYRKIFEVDEHSNFRWDTSLYYYSRERFGSHFLLQYEQQLSENSLFRFDNHYYFRDQQNDWVWQHGWYNFRQWDEKTAMIYGFYVEGNSRPNYRLEEYLLSSRWRKNAVRDWLFFEVEPFAVWRRDEGFDTSFGLALRVEGYFGK